MMARKFHTRIQQSTETINDYATELRSLARAAYVNMHADDRDRLMKEVFLAGVNPKIADRISIGTEPASFDIALQLAQKHENYLTEQGVLETITTSSEFDKLTAVINAKKSKPPFCAQICALEPDTNSDVDKM